jgi:hypothetical protein
MPLQVDTATRERSLESQLQLARRHLGTAEQQAGAQAEPASHDKDPPANSIAEELAQVCPSDRSPTDAPPLSPASHRPPPACAQARAAIEEQKSVASHWMRSCKQAACPAGRMGRRLTQRTCHMHGPSRVAPPKPWHRCRPTRRSRAQSWPRATLPSARAAAGTRGACAGSRPAHGMGPPRERRARGHRPQLPAGTRTCGRGASMVVCAWHVHGMCMACAGWARSCSSFARSWVSSVRGRHSCKQRCRR